MVSMDMPTGEPPGADGPVGDDFAGFEIDDGYLIFVLEIDVDLSIAIGGEELRLSAQRDGWVDLSMDGIDVGLEGHEHSTVS